MATVRSRFTQFRADIRQLISEIERYVGGRQARADREYQLQCEAFEERRDRAQQLSEEIETDEQTMWGLRDGDAKRVHDSLRMSLDYFRQDA
ncbi:MAG: hypothetical protein ACR2QV_04785 [Gammaproteobacteria bacterium]